MLSRSNFSAAALIACLICLPVHDAFAVHPAVTLDEVAQKADLVFSGTVSSVQSLTSGTAIFTEVTFSKVSHIAASNEARQTASDEVKLLFAGGQVNGGFLRVSGTPSFESGEKYLLFLLDDGRPYVNPIVGGSQGIFRVVTDPATGKEVVANQSGKGLTGVNSEGRPTFTATPVTGGPSGKTTAASGRFQPVEAISSDGTVAPAAVPRQNDPAASAMTVNEFADYIKNQALKREVRDPQLKINEKTPGKFYRMNNGQIEAEDLISTESSSLKPVHDTNGAANTEMSVAPDTAPRGQALGACGAYDLNITMERYPSSITGYQINEDCMSHYNSYMDIFRVRDSDGSIGGGNGQSEFGGFHNDTTLMNMYGYTWDGSVGLCFTYSASSSACSEIIESDVYYNPAYSYSDDPYVWFNNTSVFNLRTVAIHEIGHVWGYQLGVSEAYDYDDPSVMHAVYQRIFETGHGLHATDAYIFRRHYDDQTSIRSISDVGVEAYYASNGLIKATINGSSFTRGSTMSFSKVTVENLGRSTAQTRLRFYLSDSHGFSGNYYQVGNNWTFGTTGLGPESYSTNDYNSNTIPSNVPPGTYYVLAHVDVPSGTDNYGSNNTAVFTDRVTVTAPTISRTPSLLSSSITTGQTAPGQSFTIRNSGGGTLNYSMGITYNSSSSGWVSLSPSSGTSTGETDTITVSYSTASLPAGYHSATINITDPNATNSGQTVLVSMDVTAPAGPPNDHLRNAFSLSGVTGSVTGTNANATSETGEPVHGTGASTSAWWSWTAPSAGQAVISTQGSSFDTVLGVYTGSNYPLTAIGKNDDYASPERYSRVDFNATSGTTYKIAVAGYNGISGNITLTYSFTAANSPVADWNLY